MRDWLNSLETIDKIWWTLVIIQLIAIVINEIYFAQYQLLEMKKTIGQIFEWVWMFILLALFWPKGEVKNREEELAKLYKPKDQLEVNKFNKEAYNKLSEDKHYE